MKEKGILILDFGGQYKQLIARKIREFEVYSEIKPYDYPISEIASEVKAGKIYGIILTGGPSSVNEENSLKPDRELYKLGVPILGICYGAQIIAKDFGGAVKKAGKGEYGRVSLEHGPSSELFSKVSETIAVWMSHFDKVCELPEAFKITAKTEETQIAAFENSHEKIYAVQFHPEVKHTEYGTQILKNFVFNICGASKNWKIKDYVKSQVSQIRRKLGNSRVICGLSGGVDSSVAARIVQLAVGKQLTCIFVDHGFMRKDEGDEIERIFKQEFDADFVRINAADRFLNKLAGVSDPEKKRKIIGEEFIRVFEEASSAYSDCNYLVQGTIYPDVIESGVGGAVIKSHHNVGGLPEDVNFKGIIEPLRSLFKDEVRKVGLEVGLPEKLVWRQPFPGPGLAIRVLGEISKEKLDTLREADAIFREEVYKAGIYRDLGQFFAVLTNVKSVGVQGDERSYSATVALRAVDTSDFMTADWSRIPYEILAKVSSRITNEVRGVNRVVYDISSKPPATIEWE